MRRGAAWPPAEQPSSWLVVQRQSRGARRWPHRQAVMLAECRVCRPQQHGSPSERRRRARMSGCPQWPWSPCPHPRVQRPPVRCPVPGVRACGVHASAVQRPSVDVRCPTLVSARSASTSAVSAPATSWSASERGQPHGQEGAQVWRLLYPRTARPSALAKWPLVQRAWRRIGRVAQIRGGDYAPWSSWEPGPNRLVSGEPSELDCDLRSRPQRGRTMLRAPPARCWRRSDLRDGGWR
jgi:hypothetical protein